jgi:hypothetical protein
MALARHDPYQRRVAVGAALALLVELPEAAHEPFVPNVSDDAGGDGDALSERTCGEIAALVITALVRQPIVGARAAANPDAALGTELGADPVAALVTEAIELGRVFDRLHAVVTRLTCTAVLSAPHVAQAADALTPSAAKPDALPEGERDSLGDLLLVGQFVTAQIYSSAVRQTDALPEAARKLTEELEQLETQLPHRFGRGPVDELWQPTAVGINAPGSDAYTSTLLAIIERVCDRVSERPAWWTDDFIGALEQLEATEVAPAAQQLSSLATREGVRNRFGSLLFEPVQARARRLAQRFRPPGSAVDERSSPQPNL